MNFLLKLSAVLMFTLALSGCYSVPYTNRSELMLSSEESEITMGKEAFSDIKEQNKISTDSEMVSSVKRVGENISKAADKNNFEWEFVVIDSEEVNAFCLPGGKVAVYSGLFKYVKNDGELATVLGHETGHAVARHAGEQISQGYLTSAGGIMVDAALAIVGVPGVFGSVYGVAANLGVTLPYSRREEYEADHIGLMLMAKAGYDPKTALTFWEEFSKESDYGPLKEFFVTHPMGEKRIDELKKNLPDAEKIYNAAPIKLGTGQSINVHHN